MSIISDICRFPKNSLLLNDAVNQPIYLDTTFNTLLNKDNYLVNHNSPAFFDYKLPIKPIIRFARLLPVHTQNEYSTMPVNMLYTVYSDIDNNYTIYREDRSASVLYVADKFLPVFDCITSINDYSACLQPQPAPISPPNMDNEAFRFSINSKSDLPEQNSKDDITPEEPDLYSNTPKQTSNSDNSLDEKTEIFNTAAPKVYVNNGDISEKDADTSKSDEIEPEQKKKTADFKTFQSKTYTIDPSKIKPEEYDNPCFSKRTNIDPFSQEMSFCYDDYCIIQGKMHIVNKVNKPGETEPELFFTPFTNFIVIPVCIERTMERDELPENELILNVFVTRFYSCTIRVKSNKTEHLIKEIQKYFPQACLEPFVKFANRHLSAYLSKMLADVPIKSKYKKPGWNFNLLQNGQRTMFYCNDMIKCNEYFSPETGKRLNYYSDITRSQAFFCAVKLLTLADMTVTLPMFLFSHIGVMFSLFEEAGFAPKFLLNIVGHTGSLKTSVSKIFFKILEDNRGEIASTFNDTATAMEIKMGNTYDDVLLVDDFRPSSNKNETIRMRNSLEKLVRYFGDGVGKSRGNPMLTLNKEFRPHGVCAMTGEYLYGVPSSLLRMLIIHINADTFNKDLLKIYQERPLLFPTHIRFFIDYVRDNYDSIVNYIKTNFDTRRNMYSAQNWESRLVQTATWLDLTANIIFKQYAVNTCLTSSNDAERQFDQCFLAIKQAVEKSNEIAANTEPHKMFLTAIINESRNHKIWIADSKKTYKENIDFYIGYVDTAKNRLYLRPSRAFNVVQTYCNKMDMRFTETEKNTRQALLLNGYIQGQSEYDKDNTSYVIRLDNNKEVRMLAFFLDKIKDKYGSIVTHNADFENNDDHYNDNECGDDNKFDTDEDYNGDDDT